MTTDTKLADVIARWIMSESDRWDLDDEGDAAAADLIATLQKNGITLSAASRTKEQTDTKLVAVIAELRELYRQYIEMTGPHLSEPFNQGVYDRLLFGLLINAKPLLSAASRAASAPAEQDATLEAEFTRAEEIEFPLGMEDVRRELSRKSDLIKHACDCLLDQETKIAHLKDGLAAAVPNVPQLATPLGYEPRWENSRKPMPRPWRVHHDEDVWVLDANGDKIVVNVFDVQTAELIVNSVNGTAHGGQGWQWVPKEPTTKMLAAFEDANGWSGLAWNYMLAAAPEPESIEAADAELAGLLSKTRQHWITGREITKENAKDMLCLRMTLDDRARLVAALSRPGQSCAAVHEPAPAPAADAVVEKRRSCTCHPDDNPPVQAVPDAHNG